MSTDGLNTIDPEVAEKFVSEYERNEAELVSYAARCREGRKPFTERRKAILERALNDGLNREAFLDEIEDRKIARKREARENREEVTEQRELLKTALGGLPLGDWGVEQISGQYGLKSAAIPGAVPDPEQMTLAEAKAILAEPRKPGRQSAAAKARRMAAERVVAEAGQEAWVEARAADGASGAQAEAIAAAMEGDEFDRFAAGQSDDDRDLRPAWLRGDDSTDSPAIN